MLVYPLRRRQIVIQDFTQKSVLFPFPAEKNSHYIHFKFHDLWISIFNLPNTNYFPLFVTDSCFQEAQYPSKFPVFPLIIFTINRKYSVVRCRSSYSCLLYWQTSYAFTRFLLCTCFSFLLSSRLLSKKFKD